MYAGWSSLVAFEVFFGVLDRFLGIDLLRERETDLDFFVFFEWLDLTRRGVLLRLVLLINFFCGGRRSALNLCALSLLHLRAISYVLVTRGLDRDFIAEVCFERRVDFEALIGT